MANTTYQFHVTVHARSASASPGPAVEIDGLSLQTLSVPLPELGETTFDCTFEAASSRLANFERMFCEADGSFVWVSAHDEPTWQIDGNLYDRAERLLFVDLKGSCPAAEFDKLVSAFGWPKKPLMFQLVQWAVLLDEAEFRRWAGR